MRTVFAVWIGCAALAGCGDDGDSTPDTPADSGDDGGEGTLDVPAEDAALPPDIGEDGTPPVDADDAADADADADGIDESTTDDAPPIDVPDTTDDSGPPAIWRPGPGTSWQWQLTDYPVDTSIDATMYDIDLFEAPQTTIDELHAAGRIVICYFSAGSREDWRDDADLFPPEAVGNELDGWAGENWLDTRNAGVRDVMRDRLDLAATKECDGVEPDNVDGYTNDPGFPLTSDDQLDYNRFLAAEAHARGLSVGLKNDLDQIGDLLDDFDWALNEECFSYDECDLLTPFIDAGKAVFQVEYGNAALADTICPQAEALGFDTLIKRLDLDAWRVACP